MSMSIVHHFGLNGQLMLKLPLAIHSFIPQGPIASSLQFSVPFPSSTISSTAERRQFGRMTSPPPRRYLALGQWQNRMEGRGSGKGGHWAEERKGEKDIGFGSLTSSLRFPHSSVFLPSLRSVTHLLIHLPVLIPISVPACADPRSQPILAQTR